MLAGFPPPPLRAQQQPDHWRKKSAGFLSETEWKCGGCNRSLGSGLLTPPEKCPHCGVRFTEIVEADGYRRPVRSAGPPQTPSSSAAGREAEQAVGALLGLGFVCVAVVAGPVAAAVVLLVRLTRPRHVKRRRRLAPAPARQPYRD
jgi:hypothetical protein